MQVEAQPSRRYSGAANPNITAGSEASLILFQVANTASSLNGQIEVFGGEAGLIIANLMELPVMGAVLSIRIEWIW